jgi:hypothetical protein
MGCRSTFCNRLPKDRLVHNAHRLLLKGESLRGDPTIADAILEDE